MSVDYKKESFPLFYEFISYLQLERGYSPRTVYNYFIEMRMFFRYLICMEHDKSLEQMTDIDISKMDEKMIFSLTRGKILKYLAWASTEKQISPSARNRKIAVLKSFYKFLILMEYSNTNVMDSISSTKTPKTLPKYLKQEQMYELLEVVNGEFWIRDQAIILLMMSGGLRVSEVSALNLEDIGVDSLKVLGKGNKERQVFLSEMTLEAISDYLDVRPESGEKALFLSSVKKRISVRGIQLMTSKYLEKIGKGEFSCHKLRHTAATQLMDNGVNIREIQEILGHESIETTAIYTHVSSESLRQAAKKILI